MFKAIKCDNYQDKHVGECPTEFLLLYKKVFLYLTLS